jgi:hypothetical protein
MRSVVVKSLEFRSMSPARKHTPIERRSEPPANSGARVGAARWGVRRRFTRR